MPIPLDEASSTVEVTSGSLEPVQLLRVDPQASYANGDVVSFTLLGTGFSRVGEDNKILIKDKEVQVCWSDTCSFQALAVGSARKARTPALGKVVSEHQLILENVPIATFAGAATLQVRVGDSASNKLTTLLSSHGKLSVRLISGTVVALLIVLVLCLAGRGRSLSSSPSDTTRSRRARVRDALFLDEETQSYSLTKFQFYAWTGAALLGYVYLTLSRSLVQGELQFGDIPQGLPGIVAIRHRDRDHLARCHKHQGEQGGWSGHAFVAGLHHHRWHCRGRATPVLRLDAGGGRRFRLPRPEPRPGGHPGPSTGARWIPGADGAQRLRLSLGGKLARQAGPGGPRGPAHRRLAEVHRNPRTQPLPPRAHHVEWKRGTPRPTESTAGRCERRACRADGDERRVHGRPARLRGGWREGVWKRGTLSVMNPDGQRADYPFHRALPAWTTGRERASAEPGPGPYFGANQLTARESLPLGSPLRLPIIPEDGGSAGPTASE